jgi:uncharacterized membrane protein
MDIRKVADRIEATEALDVVADPVHRLASAALPPGAAKDALQGAWLGHPVHPLLTDLPIGFWTSAWTLDLVGGRRCQPAAELLIALGVLSAVPTIASGFAEFTDLRARERRSGLVHALSNATATTLYAMSWAARRRGDRVRGVALGMAGAAAATVGGYLGGHLTFRRGAGVSMPVG